MKNEPFSAESHSLDVELQYHTVICGITVTTWTSKLPSASSSHTASSSSRGPSSSPAAPLRAQDYSGSSSTRDPCCHGTAFLYPFGAAAADSMGPAVDDGDADVTFPDATPFVFYGVSYTDVFPSTNGIIALGTSELDAWQNYNLPVALTSGTPFIAAWWADGDLTYASTLPNVKGYLPDSMYFRSASPPSPSDSARMAADVAAMGTEAPFSPVAMAVVSVPELALRCGDIGIFAVPFLYVYRR